MAIKTVDGEDKQRWPWSALREEVRCEYLKALGVFMALPS